MPDLSNHLERYAEPGRHGLVFIGPWMALSRNLGGRTRCKMPLTCGSGRRERATEIDPA